MKKPEKLKPFFKDYLWGGRKLITEYNKDASYKMVAESWELSAHSEGESIIGDVKLSEFILKYPEVLGTNCQGQDLPILIKLIDANQNLSVQVHPGDSYAKSKGYKNGKTEMWLVLENEKDAYIYLGFNQIIDEKGLLQSIDDGSIVQVLNKIRVKKGDVFFVEPGTVHAICRGVVIIEVQQSSNLTYRLYDYDRVDQYGFRRELHIKDAIEVLNFNVHTKESIKQLPINKNARYESNLLVDCDYFKVYKYSVNSSVIINITEKSFLSILIIEGTTNLTYQELVTEYKKGDTIFVPAQNSEIQISGYCEFVLVCL